MIFFSLLCSLSLTSFLTPWIAAVPLTNAPTASLRYLRYKQSNSKQEKGQPSAKSLPALPSNGRPAAGHRRAHQQRRQIRACECGYTGGLFVCNERTARSGSVFSYPQIVGCLLFVPSLPTLYTYVYASTLLFNTMTQFTHMHGFLNPGLNFIEPLSHVDHCKSISSV